MINFFVMDKVAQLLYDGEVVALFQGRSEAGARALGNRSLLFNPEIEGMNDYVNDIKGRERFRPVAASVLLDKAKEWFDMDCLDDSPYMLYAVDYMLYVICCVLCIIYYILYIIYYILYIICYILYIICDILYIIYGILYLIH